MKWFYLLLYSIVLRTVKTLILYITILCPVQLLFRPFTVEAALPPTQAGKQCVTKFTGHTDFIMTEEDDCFPIYNVWNFVRSQDFTTDIIIEDVKVSREFCTSSFNVV